jgi:hypothetical protein
MPNGVIIQWGITGDVTSGTSVDVTFPVAFPNAARQIMCATPYQTFSSQFYANPLAYILSATQAKVGVAGGQSISVKVSWIAIGY